MEQLEHFDEYGIKYMLLGSKIVSAELYVVPREA